MDDEDEQYMYKNALSVVVCCSSAPKPSQLNVFFLVDNYIVVFLCCIIETFTLDVTIVGRLSLIE